VWDVDTYLAEARRLLKPGGRLLLSTHGTWLYHPHPTDFHRWTREGLERQLVSSGFVVEHTDSLVGPLAWTTQFRLLGLRHALAAVPLVGRALVPALATAMNVRMTIEDAITPRAILRDNAAVYLVVARPGAA
jgi:SAM-dependent methyltransferase